MVLGYKSLDIQGSCCCCLFSISFILNFYNATSKHKALRCDSSKLELDRELSSQQVDKGSEAKCGFFRVEVKVWKEQTAGCTRVQHGQQGKGEV